MRGEVVRQMVSFYGKEWTRQEFVGLVIHDVFRRFRIKEEAALVGVRGMDADWYVPALNLAIDYHGRNHTEPVRWFGIPEDRARRVWERQASADRRKAKLMKVAGIRYFVLNWTDDLTVDGVREAAQRFLGRALTLPSDDDGISRSMEAAAWV